MGIFSKIPSSMQSPNKQETLPCDAHDDIQLLYCSGNWTRAEDNPEVIQNLLEVEIQQGSAFKSLMAPAQTPKPSGQGAQQ